MRIIRFHKLNSSDYNFINRQIKKSGFFSKKYSNINFIKGIIYNKFLGKSFRLTSEYLNIPHLEIFNFQKNYFHKEEIKSIFARFIEKRILVFIENNLKFSEKDLDENEIILNNSKKELENIYKN